MGEGLEKLLEHARTRHLDRIAATYAVIGWLMVQAASIALPAFNAPAWSQRRACQVISADRTSMRYRSVRPEDSALRARLRELAAVRRWFGIGGYSSCCAARARR